MEATRHSTASGDDGAAAVEYGLLVGLVAAVVLTAVTALGSGLADSYAQACDAVAGGSGSSATPSGGGGGLSTAPGLAAGC